MSNLIKEPWSRIDIIKTIANAAGEQFSKNYNVQWLDVFIVLIWTINFHLRFIRFAKKERFIILFRLYLMRYVEKCHTRV